MSVEKVRSALVTAYLAAVNVPVPTSPLVGYTVNTHDYGTFDVLPTSVANVFTPTGNATPANDGEYPWLKMSKIGNVWSWLYDGSSMGPMATQNAIGNTATPDLAFWGTQNSVIPRRAPQSVPTEYDNTAFKPPANAYWCRVHFAPNPPVPVTCGVDGEDQITGFMQVDCCSPTGVGEKPAMTLVNLLLGAFKTGTRLTNGGQEVLVTSAGRAAGYVSGEWYKIPVTIYFLAQHNRNTPT